MVGGPDCGAGRRSGAWPVSCPSRAGCGDAHAGFVRWLGYYTIVVTAIYTVIPYKTPWCLLQFLLGMVLLAGVGANVLLSIARKLPVQMASSVLLLLGTGHLVWQAYRASYVLAADTRNPYVYAQTSVDVVRLEDQLQQLADASDQRYDNAGARSSGAIRTIGRCPGTCGASRTLSCGPRYLTTRQRPSVICSPQYDVEADEAIGRDAHHDGVLRAPPAGSRATLGATGSVGTSSSTFGKNLNAALPAFQPAH